MTADNKLSMLLIKDHLRDFCAEYILDHTNRLASSSIPNFDILFASDKNLKTFLREDCTAHGLVI